MEGHDALKASSEQYLVREENYEDQVVPEALDDDGAAPKPPTPAAAQQIYNIPDLLLETKRRVNYAAEVDVQFEDLPLVPGAFMLHNVLTPEECAEYISISEEMGYADAPLRILNGKENDTAQMTKSLRDADRVMWQAPDDVVEPVNNRILKFLPPKIRVREQGRLSTWAVKPQCINERWRFGRYRPGQYFKPHFDFGFNRNHDEKSHMTFIIYLNDGIDGGETVFFPEGKPQQWSAENTVHEYRTVPKVGSALVFFHTGDLSPRHEGAVHRTEGQYKYIIRSDLMYTRIADEDDPTLPGQLAVDPPKPVAVPVKSRCILS